MSQGFAIGSLMLSLVLMAAAQLLAKWRMGVLFDGAGGRRWQDIAWQAVGDGYLWIVAMAIGLAAIGWYLAMARLPIGTMIVLASLITPTVAFGGWWFFGEPMNAVRIAGIALVMIGVTLVGTQSA